MESEILDASQIVDDLKYNKKPFLSFLNSSVSLLALLIVMYVFSAVAILEAYL